MVKGIGKFDFYDDINIGNATNGDKRKYDIDDEHIELKKSIRIRYQEDSRHRRGLICWIKWVISIWLGAILVIISFAGLNIFSLDTTVICVLLGTTTINVLGLAYIVLKGLFEKNTKVKNQ